MIIFVLLGLGLLRQLMEKHGEVLLESSPYHVTRYWSMLQSECNISLSIFVTVTLTLSRAEQRLVLLVSGAFVFKQHSSTRCTCSNSVIFHCH